MRKILAISLMLVGVVVAVAQPAPVQQPTEYTFKLKAAQVDIIGRALGKLPFEDVAEIVGLLRQQIAEQQQLLNTPKVLEKKK